MEIFFLAIETSCDDTAVALLRAVEQKGVLEKIEALSNVVSSQTQLHAQYGGVYPFLAKREHKKNLPAVFKQATEGSPEQEGGAVKGFDFSKTRFIAVTKGPGLDPCLWTGINFAQELAKKHNLPLIGANHLEAHFLANLLTLGVGENEFEKEYLPAVCLVVSGGHTLLFLAKEIGKYRLLGETQDDAAGECFDKTARILGLGYPGGAEISKLAKEFIGKNPSFRKHDKDRISGKSFEDGSVPKFPRPMMNQKNYNFSFSGLKTAVLYFHQKQPAKIKRSKEYLEAMSYEIQQAIVDVLVSKTKRAAKEFKARSIIIGGGVSANELLRQEIKKASDDLDAKFLAPSYELSTDNAAMAGVAGYFAWKRGEAQKNPDDLQSKSNLSIE